MLELSDFNDYFPLFYFVYCFDARRLGDNCVNEHSPMLWESGDLALTPGIKHLVVVLTGMLSRPAVARPHKTKIPTIKTEIKTATAKTKALDVENET